MLTIIRHLWREYYTALLLLLAFGAGLVWGINIGRGVGPGPDQAAAPTSTPTGEYVALSPDHLVEAELDPPSPEMTPPAEAHLRVRVDVRDAVTGQPVRAEVWLTTIVGEESEDTLIRAETSLVEVALPGPAEANEVYVKVLAKGYYLWVVGIRHSVVYERVLPLEVRLEAIEGEGGSG